MLMKTREKLPYKQKPLTEKILHQNNAKKYYPLKQNKQGLNKKGSKKKAILLKSNLHKNSNTKQGSITQNVLNKIVSNLEMDFINNIE